MRAVPVRVFLHYVDSDLDCDGDKGTWTLSAEYYLSKRTSLQAVAFSNKFSGGYWLDPLNIAALGRFAGTAKADGHSVSIRRDFRRSPA